MRILFITSNRIGDAVLSTGGLAWMLDAFPMARVTVACGPAAAGLFEAVPRLETLLVMRKRPYSLHWLDLWRRVAFTRWRAVADLRGSATAYLVPTCRRFVLAAARPDRHKVRQVQTSFRLSEPPAPRLWSGDAHRRQAAAALPTGGPVLALAPTANWIGKQWPADRFVALARELTAPGGILPGARVAVFGAAAERDAAAPVLAALDPSRTIDLVGRTDLLTAYECLRRCALFVGNDSGLMHIAASSGVPTLGLFGPSRDEWYAPWGPNTQVVRTDLSYRDIVATPGYDYRLKRSWMESLAVEKVARAAIALFARSADAAPAKTGEGA